MSKQYFLCELGITGFLSGKGASGCDARGLARAGEVTNGVCSFKFLQVIGMQSGLLLVFLLFYKQGAEN